MPYKVIQGDCIGVLKDLDDESFDSVVTDPPYALSFMGKDWDSFGNGLGYQAWCETWARELLRVLKPGGFLLAFGGTRTYHRLTTAIEDAGFEIRDSLHWIYGSGFPKSRDISKAIDSEAGAKRTVISQRDVGPDIRGNNFENATGRMIADITAPATEAAKAWAGWGTALKPAHEPIVMARKPLSERTVAANVLKHQTGGINIDGCRVGTQGGTGSTGEPNYKNAVYGRGMGGLPIVPLNLGRWPPNVVFTHSPGCEPTGETRKVKTAYCPENEYAGSPDKDVYGSGLNQRMSPAHGDLDGTETLQVWNCAEDCPVQEMDRQSGTLKSGQRKPGVRKGMGFHGAYGDGGPEITGSQGGASRFFPCLANPDPLDSSACFRYQAKASKKERPALDGIPGHPTVKPVALMQWLVRLVTPPGGYVLDPFAGTGTTAEACWLEGFDCLLIERDSDSIRRIEKRMSKYETEAADT